MTATQPRQGSTFGMTIGLMAVVGGLWLLLDSMEVGIPRFKDLWPSLFIVAGLGSIADYLFLLRRPSSAGWAVAWIGFGVLFFALTLDFTSLARILDWLPSFPTILGLSLLATWLADRRKNDNLMIAGVVLVALGILGYGARFDWLQKILPSAQVLWAVILLAGGSFLVWRTVVKTRG
ncbi:MAG: hypothetical protein AAF560_25395 [Acidobacteriota bacterium]